MEVAIEGNGKVKIGRASSPGHDRLAPVSALCSIVAAAAFGALPVLSIASPDFNPAHPWLFAAGAAAFASNLLSGLPPAARAVSALAQAMCVFELLGFSVAVTLWSFSGPSGWPTMSRWQWLASWGLLGVCVAALVLPAVVRRRVRRR